MGGASVLVGGEGVQKNCKIGGWGGGGVAPTM